MSICQFFPSGQKKLLRVGSESNRVKAGLASYLLLVKSKLGSGQGPYLDPTQSILKFLPQTHHCSTNSPEI